MTLSEIYSEISSLFSEETDIRIKLNDSELKSLITQNKDVVLIKISELEPENPFTRVIENYRVEIFFYSLKTFEEISPLMDNFKSRLKDAPRIATSYFMSDIVFIDDIQKSLKEITITFDYGQ